MPKYSWRIDELLWEDEVRKMYDKAKNDAERTLISLCWLTGARTQEILQLKPMNITFTDSEININLKTEKLGELKDFRVSDRTLRFERKNGENLNIYIETIINRFYATPKEERLLDYTNRWAEKVINRLGIEVMDKPICPYHFRHSVMVWLMRNGKSPDQLMYFKGARSLSSVMPYLHAQAQLVPMENLRRSRNGSQNV